MILVDTSVWVDHFRRGDAALAGLLARAQVLIHPFVVGEIACSGLRDAATVLGLLRRLPAAPVAAPDEVLRFVERHRLDGRGIGYVDVHLLAATALAHGGLLWTHDRRLADAARVLKIAAPTLH